MQRRHLARLRVIVLVGLLAAACSHPAPQPSPQPLPSAPVAGEVAEEPQQVPATPLALDQPAVVEAPATLTARDEPFQPVLPTPSPSPTLDWAQSLRPTALLAGPADDAPRFSILPALSYLKILESRPGWKLVVYGGDGATRAPGNAWVRAEDVAPPKAPPQWAKNHRFTGLWPTASAMGTERVSLPQWSLLELAGQEANGRLLVRVPGNGRTVLPTTAWVEARDVGPVQTPDGSDIPRAYPLTLRPDVIRLNVPYRSQLDGEPWQDANCGPVALGMALEAIGMPLSSTQLRREVQNAQQVWGDDVGSFMEALVDVAEGHHARVVGFLEQGQIKRWSLEDIRAQLRAGRAVIPQVYYRALPGRENSPYRGDHFVVITGMVGDSFLYNDPIDHDGVGFDRIMTPPELERAMNASAQKYARAAFAVGKP